MFTDSTRRTSLHSDSDTLSPNVSADQLSEPFLASEEKYLSIRRQKPRIFIQALPWILTLFFMTTSIVQFSKQLSPLCGFSKTGIRATDFKSLTWAIEPEEVTFTGAPVFSENGTFQVPHPGSVTYVGPPSPQIDEAWENITAGRYFLITADEAREAFGSASDLYWNDAVGGYMAGIDMFHALHCLNRIRQSLWPDYYPQSGSHNTQIHQEHCIDHIRQMLMCSGDMTLIPTEWTSHLGRNYVNSDVPHTCRNFEKLRDAVVARRFGSTRVAETSEKKHSMN